LSKGITKASVLLKHSGIQVDIRLVNSLEFGATLLYFTGSKEHNIKLRSIAKNSGYKINEYGLFDIKTDKRLAGATEEEMYHLLHLQFIPPQLRVDKGEIEKACLSGKETIAPNKLKKNLLYAND
jgi:DNA polymerase (family 10)